MDPPGSDHPAGGLCPERSDAPAADGQPVATGPRPSRIYRELFYLGQFVEVADGEARLRFLKADETGESDLPDPP